jgi:thiol-disulfide isomerase/thioredoxin
MTTARSLLLLACLPAAALGAPTTGTKIGETIPDLKATATVLTDAKPRGLPVDTHKTKRPTAYVFVGTTCPATQRYLGRMKDLEEAYRGKVDFLFVYPNRTDTSPAKEDFHRKSGLASPMVDDAEARIAKALAATRTSEVLLAAKTGTLLYRGAIDDSADPNTVKTQYVRAALDAHLAGKPVGTTTTEVRA